MATQLACASWWHSSSAAHNGTVFRVLCDRWPMCLDPFGKFPMRVVTDGRCVLAEVSRALTDGRCVLADGSCVLGDRWPMCIGPFRKFPVCLVADGRGENEGSGVTLRTAGRCAGPVPSPAGTGTPVAAAGWGVPREGAAQHWRTQTRHSRARPAAWASGAG